MRQRKMNSILRASGSLPFSHATVPWNRAGSPRFTVIVKASFTLAPGAVGAPLTPMPVLTRDVYRGGDSRASLALSAENAPFLPAANILLSASAYPRASTSASFTTRLVVWNDTGVVVDKPVFVRPLDGRAVPLHYERSPRNSANPVGSERPDAIGATNRDDVPIGFGPIAREWPTRVAYLRGESPPVDADEMTIEGGFDYRFFNAAPLDQQVPFLRGDEALRLERLHPDTPNFVTRLPAAQIRARRGDEPLDLQLDMLVLDGHRWLVSLIWRGNFRRDERDEPIEIALKLGKATPLGPTPAAVVATPWDASFKPVSIPPPMAADATLVPERVSPPGPVQQQWSPSPPTGVATEALAEGPDETVFQRASVAQRPALPFTESGAKDSADETPRPVALPWEKGFSSERVAPGLDVDETLPFGSVRPKRLAHPSLPARDVLPPVGSGADSKEPSPSTTDLAASPAAVPIPPRFAAAVATATSIPTPSTAPPVDPLRAAVLERLAKKQSLSGMDLASADLRDLDLSEQVLTGARLDRCDLSRSKLLGSELSSCSMERATLRDVDFSGANLDRADLSKTDLSGAKLTHASLTKTILERASLDKTVFDFARLGEARLRGATGAETSFRRALLDGADLKQAKLPRACFEGASLRRVDAARCEMVGGDFRNADLRDANLRPANLAAADLRGALLDGADLRDADLSGANLAGVRLERAKLKGTILKNATFD